MNSDCGPAASKTGKPEVIDVDQLPFQDTGEDTWLTIGGYNLNEYVKCILNDPRGWLTDEPIDAAQYLI